jgi:hypothetical protein
MKIIGEVITMAKFVLPDDSIESWDNIKEEKVHHKVSPALMIEMRLIDTLMKISNNLSNETLTGSSCILDYIAGEPATKDDCDRNCHRCICQWYMKKD